MNVRCASVWIASLLMLATVTGCPRKAVVSSGKATNKAASAEDLLKSAIHQLRPENVGFAAAPDKPVSLLNSWRGMLADARQDGDGAEAETPAPPADWTSAEVEKRLKSDKFDELDAVHIRDCLLTHTLATYLAARSNDELQRVQEVFQFVVRNIALLGDDAPELPISTYLILMTGRGTPEDRAWICASVLRQLRIDCVIVRPSDAAKAADGDWLLGVILNDRVHLFDAKLGLAIPSSSEAGPAGFKPATLAEISDHAEWLQQLTARADQPYGIDAASLKVARVMPIAEPGFWSRRMSRLEQVLPTESACILFDPPTDDLGRSGLIKRIQIACPSLNPGNIKLWPYPERQLSMAHKTNSLKLQQMQQLAIEFGVYDRLGHTSPATFQQMQQLCLSFNTPITVRVDPQTGQPSETVPERKMLRIRTDQLLGKFEDATQRYLSIRHLEIEPNQFAKIVQLHRLAAEDAIYWSGLSKFEAEEYEAAVEQLTGYIKRFDRKGRWTFAARSLLAECRVRQGKFAEAVTAIERTVSEDPYREANAVRIKRWTPLVKKTGDASSKQ